jgi:rhodanese-related sulfurtransferase
MAPLPLMAPGAEWLAVLLPLVIGVGFGASLEMSGFGDSRKLAAQFYLRDMTVLKVMFTGIIVAGTLIGLSAALGLLDIDRVFVNPTFLLSGIVGGLIMGIGFIIGGFCPGTSLVAASTLKIDGLVFLIGVAAGIFAFGETVGLYPDFWNRSAMGRFTLPELFGVDAGIVLVGVVAMALFMFRLAELAEAHFGRRLPASALRFFPSRKLAWTFGAVLLLSAGVAAAIGQPDAERLWALRASGLQERLDQRAVYVHPLEVAELIQDTTVHTRILDLRPEQHFNLFHLKGAVNVDLAALGEAGFVKALKALPPNTALFTVSTDEQLATAGWQLLTAQGVANVYVIEGGINRWLEVFPPLPCLAAARPGPRAPESLAYTFFRSVGDCCSSASPAVTPKRLPFDCYLSANPASPAHSRAGAAEPEAPALGFERKVVLQKKSAVKGGCG